MADDAIMVAGYLYRALETELPDLNVELDMTSTDITPTLTIAIPFMFSRYLITVAEAGGRE